MLEDFREFAADSPIETDVCIIGAGAAGITLATALANTSLEVCLLDSGGTSPQAEVQDLGLPENRRGDYLTMGCQMRMFGGSTSHWGGWSLPFSPIDFEQRNWVEHSGWPFARDELMLWYEKANDVIGLGDFAYSWKELRSKFADTPEMELDSLLNLFWRIPANPTGFAARHQVDLESAPNIRIITHATVTALNAEASGRKVSTATVASLNGHTTSVKARLFVVAAGAIGSAHLLLVSNAVHKNGLGNDHDNVGRFFMMHPHESIGTAMNMDAGYARYFDVVKDQGSSISIGIGPSEKAQREHAILNCSIRLETSVDTSTGYYAAQQVMEELELLYNGWKVGIDLEDLNVSDEFGANVWKAIKDLDSVILGPDTDAASGAARLVAQSEQAPNPNSRIILGTERNSLGVLRVIQDCRLLEIDRHTLQVMSELIGRELGAKSAGRVQTADWLIAEEFEWPKAMWGGCHHMGTTRMTTDPTQGVVDENSRLHSVNNVYVAGSGVFPTGSFANPTMTAVALTLRLAEHLKSLDSSTIDI